MELLPFFPSNFQNNFQKFKCLWNWSYPPQSLDRRFFWGKKPTEKGCYSLIIPAYFLVVHYWYVLRVGPTQVVRMDNLPFQAKLLWRLYAIQCRHSMNKMWGQYGKNSDTIFFHIYIYNSDTIFSILTLHFIHWTSSTCVVCHL